MASNPASNPGTGPPAGNIPVAPPPSRFLTTGRSNAEINRVLPKLRQEERDQLTETELMKIQAMAVAPLTEKFSLPKYKTDKDLLQSTYDINQQINDFLRRLQYYDMVDAFKILNPLDHTSAEITSPRLQMDAASNPVTVELTQNFTSLDDHRIQLHVYFLRKYGQSYDLQNLDWSRELLENSCDIDLREKVDEKLQKLPTGLISGPLYFFHMIELIMDTSETVANTIVTRLENLHLNQTEGENVLMVVSLLRGAIKRLSSVNRLPQDINSKILQVFQTTSVQDFNDIFKYMSTASKLKQQTFTTEEILNVAESNYTEFSSNGKWTGISSRHSTFISSNVVCHGCGGQGHVIRDCPNAKKATPNPGANLPDVDVSKLRDIVGTFKFTDPIFTTPPAKGVKVKMVNGTLHYWCHHCSRWQKSHGTQGHTGKKKNDGRRPNNRNNNRSNANANVAAQQQQQGSTNNDSDPSSITSSNDSATSTISSGFVAAAGRIRGKG